MQLHVARIILSLSPTKTFHNLHPYYVRPPNFCNILGPFDTFLGKRPPSRLAFPDSDESVLAEELCNSQIHVSPKPHFTIPLAGHSHTGHLTYLSRSLERVFGQVAMTSECVSRSHWPVVAVAALFPLQTALLLLLLVVVPLVVFLALCERRLPQCAPHALDLRGVHRLVMKEREDLAKIFSLLGLLHLTRALCRSLVRLRIVFRSRLWRRRERRRWRQRHVRVVVGWRHGD